MTADQWIQVGIFLMMGGANALVLIGIVNKNSRASGELSATVKNFGGIVADLKEGMKELYQTRLDHEKRLTEMETGIEHCEPCNAYRQRRITDK
jgi:hypothetical protein